MPAVEVSAPARSKRPRVRTLSGSASRLRSSSPIPIGMLTMKIQRQDAQATSMPPAIRPTALPPIETTRYMPSALVRSRPSRNCVISNASAVGEASAPPRPWIARAASSTPAFGASPPSSEARVNTAIPVRNMRRWPSRSPARAPSSSRPPNVNAYALTTQDRFSGEKWSAPWMSGSAMFTIVRSRMTINWPMRIEASAACGWPATLPNLVPPGCC